MRSPARLLFILLSTVIVSAWPSTSGAWLIRVAGTDAGNGHFFIPEIATTAAGDVAFAGTLAVGQQNEIAVLFVDGATGTEVWRYTDGAPYAQALAVATDPTGDVIVGGFIRDAGVSQELVVRKLDGATGAELWAYNRGGHINFSLVDDLAVDASGDVVLAARRRDPGATQSDFFVAKLDAGTGTEKWTVTITDGRASNVAIAPGGNVVATGTVSLAPIVVEFDGTTGAELWRNTTSVFARDVAIDGSGDIVLPATHDDEFVVVKLEGAAGTEVWRYENAGGDSASDVANAVAIDPAGDVIAVGSLDDWIDSPLGDQSFFAVKLDGATGAEEWTHMRTSDRRAGGAADVAVDLAGEVFVAGTITYEDNNGHGKFALAERLDGATGAAVWAHQYVGTGLLSTSPGNANIFSSIALTPLGDVTLTGDIRKKKPHDDFGAMKLDRDDGSMASLDGTKLLIKDPGDPTKRFISFVAKSPVVQSPPPGSIGDPVAVGATFRLWNPTTLEEATFFLPPGPNWKGLGKPAGTSGWKYKDKFGDHGPCKARINAAKQIKVICKGKLGLIPFTLDEASQGALAASLQFGIESPQCTEFGGTLLNDAPGIFKAKSAPPLAACP